jgi:hypothetical protein
MRGKFVAGLLLLAGLVPAGVARAGIIPDLQAGSPTTVGANNFRFTYDAGLGPDARVDDGDYFVIYDFAGYNGAHTEPAGWDFTVQNAGPYPFGTLPLDDPGVPNLVWTWTRESNFLEDLGDFSANSTFGAIAVDTFTSLTTRSTGPNIGTDISNVGFVNVPVPEPTAVSVLAVGAMVALRRRK